MHYLKFKREQTGKCNICGKIEKLTWDHVPPKGGQAFNDIEQESIFQYLAGSNGERRYQFSQNGVKYRTICSNCNNALLGAKADPVLNELAADVMLMIKTRLTLPQATIHVKTKPALICKSLLGHMLSATGDFGMSKIDDRYREYVLDEAMIIPKGIKVFYWIYPYMSLKVIRDIAMPRYRGEWSDFSRGGVGMFSILKYPPVGYLATDLNEYEGLHELTQYCGSSLDDEAEIPFRLDVIQPEYWPEAGEDNFVMGGEGLGNGVSARPRSKRK
ncbi:hypothetical protein SAMN02799630_00560 [Paenibacillus sp. UNCCL117]|uniref:hypothetical protein n=1 Tax=unclassified Paenibacillus TaxID=185978 RepID=UPI0008863796|nr:MULTISPECIES: hypothetical protein [unclassified Paenibacillus]SDC11103.1 hypothetical protein SAMN04488602_101360 [Paenibacillus sp. cl123]SFW16522.1 hypothetical protein SAMN02799630_00560 [Paenibacillus sp. UNCCL117]